MAEEVEEVRQDNDSVERWLYEEDVQVSDIDQHRMSEVYGKYNDWCRSAGERNPCKMRTFSGRIKDSRRFGRVTFVTESIRFGAKTGRVFSARVTEDD